MRTSKIAEYWRAIDAARGRRFDLKQFSFASIPGLIDGTITFQSPLTAICGLNGSGKSAILRALWAALDQEAIQGRPEVVHRLKGGELKTRLRVDDQDLNARLLIEGGGSEPALPEELSVEHLDLARLAPRLQELFCKHVIDELLSAYEPIDLKQDEIELLSFVCRKDFKDIKIYEIDEFNGEVLPFITAADSDFQYDVRTMSLGEISLIVCYWVLRRAAKGAIILLEEPETFISPVSQEALIDLFVTISVTRQITLIFTTHSPQMFSRLKEDAVKFLFRGNQGSQIAAATQFGSMRNLVGLKRAVDLVLLVEDRAAREFTRLLIGRLDVGLAGRAEVIDVGGEGNITAVRRCIPLTIKSCRFVGVYDGDQRGKVETVATAWPLVFLPDALPVEKLFQVLAGKEIELFGSKLGRNTADLQAVLAGLQGQEPHEWFEKLVKALGMTYDQVMMGCFEAWFSREDNRKLSESFVSELLQIVA